MITSAQIRAGRALIAAKQSELAKSAGVALATLNNIERGVGDPRASTLDAIERALSQAGVEFDGDRQKETVTLQRLARPNVHDTYFASQYVLECMTDKSLLKAKGVRFFIRVAGHLASDEDPHRIGIVVEGAVRTLLFDQIDFSLANSARVAEFAAMYSAAFSHCPGQFEFVDFTVEDTAVANLDEAVRRLSGLAWKPLTHPRELVDVFANWNNDIAGFADKPDHPMHAAVAMAEGLPPDVQDTEPDNELETPPDGTLSVEEVARLLNSGETVEEDVADAAPPLTDPSAPAGIDDAPPLADPSAPAESSEQPQLMDPSSPVASPVDLDTRQDISRTLEESDEDDEDPLSTTPPPAFNT